METNGIKDVVKEKYGEAARRAASGGTACCGPTCCGGDEAIPGARDPITSNLYDASQTLGSPAAAVQRLARLRQPDGARASCNAGETVLDLGSGGGIDVLLSARRVGPTGKAYGLDMTDEMLALAGENKRKAGVDERRVPARARSRTSRCPTTRSTSSSRTASINLSADKDRVLARGVPRAQARRALRRVRRRRPRRGARRRSARTWSSGSAASPARSKRRSTTRSSATAGLRRRRRSSRRAIYTVEDARAFLDGAGPRRGRDRAAGGREVHQRVHPRAQAGQPSANRCAMRLASFERYLSLWVALCMAAGLVLGKASLRVRRLRGLEFGRGSQINARSPC